MEKQVIICEFEFVDHGKRVVVYPVGLPGATEGMDYNDAVAMSYDWLRETALDYVAKGKTFPDVPIGTNPQHGGKIVTIATEVGLDDVESISVNEAADELGVSTARVAQLCSEGLLDSWKVGSARRISKESVEVRKLLAPKAGRPAVVAD